MLVIWYGMDGEFIRDFRDGEFIREFVMGGAASHLFMMNEWDGGSSLWMLVVGAEAEAVLPVCHVMPVLWCTWVLSVFLSVS